MSAPASAQSLKGIDPLDLNAIVNGWDDIDIDEVVDGPEFPVSGDATTLAAPFYASIDRANRAGKTTLGRIIADTHRAKDEAGRLVREKAPRSS